MNAGRSERFFASGESTDFSFLRGPIAFLLNPNRLHEMKLACRHSCAQYTVENMARNFADGVERCLQNPGYRGVAQA